MALANFPLYALAASALLCGGCVSKASSGQSDILVKEMSKLPAPVGATLEQCKYSAKSSSQRLYSCLYNAKLTFPELLAAYGKQLQANGWHKSRTEKLRDWGRDLGGEDVTYCKASLQLNLQFAGDRANYGWQYAIATSVGVPPYICGG